MKSEIIKIAWRNLWEHRSKTLIIGGIITLSMIFLVVGNSFLATTVRGIQKNYRDNYTGDVVITERLESFSSIFGGQNESRQLIFMKLPYYREVYAYARSLPGVLDATPVLSGAGFMRKEDNGGLIFEGGMPARLFGIEPESYRRVFSGIRITEGHYLKPGERGIMISEKLRRDVVDFSLREAKKAGVENPRISLTPGDQIHLLGFAGAVMVPKIRILKLVAVYEPVSDANTFADYLGFTDADTMRSILGRGVGGEEEVRPESSDLRLIHRVNREEAAQKEKAASATAGEGSGIKNAPESPESDLSAESQGDALFDDASLVTETRKNSGDDFSFQNLNALLKTAPEEKQLPVSVKTGSWGYLLLKAKKDRIPALIEEINAKGQKENWGIEAYGWAKAIGGIGYLIRAMNLAFTIVILIVSAVSVIIIMNTLVVSVLERSSEIGTIRALGGRKSFVWSMFMSESLILSLFFGFLGIALASLLIYFLNRSRIPVNNDILQVLISAKTLRIDPSLAVNLQSFGVTILVGFAAHLYPVQVALKVSPRKAMEG